ncbi:MAG: right-handed parallel beta-helix repeat-containing protein [Gemmatimonadota bacterium]
MMPSRLRRGYLGVAALALAAGCTADPVVPTNIPGSGTELAPAGTANLGGTVVVKPSSMNGWYFWNDRNDVFTGSPGELVTGPASPPAGVGSVRLGPLTDDGTTAAGHSVIATNAYAGTPLANITDLSYASYQPGPTLAVAMQFDVKYRTTDVAYGGRLIFEPYQNGAASVGAGWQSWTPLAGRWWASKTSAAGSGGAQVVALPAGNCAQATPCTWAELMAAFPQATISGRFLLKAGSNWNGFDGNADNLVVGVSGLTTTYDFEQEAQCTAVCYADAVTGNDAFGGGTAANAKQHIQAAINQVSAGGVVRVLPGTYNESAPNSVATSVGGTYQFGLFFGSSKPGITLMGVTAGDVPITNAAATLATINTDATNNFGTSGIFVEAVNTTIRGVTVGPNVSGDNKTIEVVADNFTLQYAATAVPGGGAVYISEFDAPAGAVSSYHLLNNRFTDATQIAISSGAGLAGPASAREIKGNAFDLGGASWPSISFNGSGGVPWFTKSVGGADISGNSFTGGSAQYIRARGTYIEAQFAWQAWWTGNTYDKATVALVTEAPFDVRSFSYTSAPYTFTNVRRIGSTIQGEVDIAVAGDAVLARAGTYPEDVVANKANLKLKGAGIDASVIVGPIGGPGSTIAIAAAGILIDGFTITRAGNTVADWNGALNSAGVAVQGQTNSVELRNSKLSGLRTGVDINNSNGNSIHNNIIDNNRTGLIFRNQTDNTSVINNFITNNWTLGVLFLDGSGGTNSPVQSAINSTFSFNNISGNWYGQIGDRQSGGSLPSPGTNLKNFSGNWLGSTAPVISGAASVEPGYAAQIPIVFGGGASAPGGQPDLTGPATANIVYIPFQCTGTDVSPAIGFQPAGILSTLAGGCVFDTQGPLTTLTPPAPAPTNTTIGIPVSISDLTTGNSPLKSYTWTRDGGVPTTITFGSSAVTQAFVLNVPADAAADVDNICVRGTDIWNNVGPEVCVMAVWYDPNAGFVTGGGWINSPAGAFPASPLLTGKANFGFVSKYEKGKTIPTGNTEFQFNAANLNFKGTVMEWLVVSGAKAQYKGSGTVNNAGDYRFMLTAIDGSAPGGGGADKFRIRIWNNLGGGLVYDNQLNAPDSADPTTLLGGGSIIIHK